MIKTKCPRCKAENKNCCYMWDCIIDNKIDLCVMVCEQCDNELNKKRG